MNKTNNSIYSEIRIVGRITVRDEVRKYLTLFRVLIVNYFVLCRPPQQSAACGEWFNGSSSSSGINSNLI